MPQSPLSANFCAASLVTGALGFVGRHLSRSLLLAGLPVVGLGKHSPDQPLPTRIGCFERNGAPTELPGAVSYSCDAGTLWYVPLAMEEPEPLAELLSLVQPASIYHLAAQSSAAFSFREPGETFASNLMGTLNLLEAVRGLKEGNRPIVLSVGSCEEYGPQPDDAFPLPEDAPLSPISPYGVSKVSQTLLCRQYVHSYDLPVIMTRSFSHTGPGHDPRFAFPSFARQIAAAEAGQGPCQLKTGDLSAVRDFLDVRDVIWAYRLLTKEGRPGEIYNVSSGRGLTIREGLEILVRGARCPITLERDPERNRPSDIPVMVGDSSKLRQETGWEPEWGFSATLMDLLEEARKEFL